MNQGAGDVKHEPAQYPQDRKKNEQDNEHRVSPFGGRRPVESYPPGAIVDPDAIVRLSIAGAPVDPGREV